MRSKALSVKRSTAVSYAEVLDRSEVVRLLFGEKPRRRRTHCFVGDKSGIRAPRRPPGRTDGVRKSGIRADFPVVRGQGFEP
jgi:hypothetical protein